MSFKYDNGLPFSDGLKDNLDDLKSRIFRDKMASLFIIDGEQGHGKTTLAVHCLEYFQGGQEIDYKNQYAMGGLELQEKLIICYNKGFHAIIYDEAGDYDSTRALTLFNFRLKKLFQVFRAFQILVIVVLPSFKTLARSMLDTGVPRFLINVYGRKNTFGNYRGFDLEQMAYIRKAMDKMTVPQFAYKAGIARLYGHFLNLPPKREKELNNISIKGKIEIASDGVLQSKGLVSKKEIASKLNRSKAWVDKKLTKYKVKAEAKHKRTAYYPKELIEKFKKEICLS